MKETSRVQNKKFGDNNNSDLIIGAGIANQSVSIDGVSQSIGTTQSAEIISLIVLSGLVMSYRSMWTQQVT